VGSGSISILHGRCKLTTVIESDASFFMSPEDGKGDESWK
jgi:hypothetical protein